jgi:predicted aspartyl protease
VCLLLGLLCLPALVQVQAQSAAKLRREAQKAIRAGDYEKAEKIYRKLLAEDQRDHQTRLDLSYTLIKNGQLDDAYRNAVVVAGQEPLHARAHALMGLALLRSGVFQRSLEELTVAAGLDRREPIALAGLAEVDFFENRAQEAYDKLRQATNLDPYEPDYWIALGRTAARLEKFKEAAGYYERFLAVSPKLDEEKRSRYRGLIDFYHALGRSHITDLHRVEGPKSATVPFQLQNSRPFIQVRINGSEPLSFVIDTGASITVLSERTANRLNVRPMARGGRARAVGGGGTFPIVYGLVNNLDISGVKLYNVPIYIRGFHVPDSKEDSHRLLADGFLGLSVLTNFRLTLDYARRELLLENPAVPIVQEELSSEVSVVSFRTTNGGLVSAEVRLGGDDTFNFLVDSGASTTVLSETVVEKMNWQDKLLPDLRVRVLGAAGVIEEVELLVVPSLTVHDLEQRNVRTPVLDMNAVNETAGFLQSGILGGSFLKHFRITFDFQRFRVLLSPQTEAVRKIVPAGEPLMQDKQGED